MSLNLPGNGVNIKSAVYLTVDDGEFHRDGQTLPLLGVFLDVLSDLLGGETERSQLWGQSCRVSHLTPDRPEDHILCLTCVTVFQNVERANRISRKRYGHRTLIMP